MFFLGSFVTATFFVYASVFAPSVLAQTEQAEPASEEVSPEVRPEAGNPTPPDSAVSDSDPALAVAENAEDSNEIPSEVVLDERVGTEELGARVARILPDSPLHVFKRFGRRVQEVLTFDPVKDASLKLRHANQELAEVKQLIDNRGIETLDPSVFVRATEHFQRSVGQLEEAAESVRKEKDSQPENVSVLLDELADKQFVQQKVLDGITKKSLERREEIGTEDPDQAARLDRILTTVEDSKDRGLNSMTKILVQVEEDPEAIGERLTRAVERQPGSEFRDLKHLEILDAMEKGVPETVKDALEIAKRNTMEQFQVRIKEIPPLVRAEKFGKYIEHTESKETRLIKLLEDIKQRADIPVDILDKIEEAKEIVADRFERKLSLINDQELQRRFVSDSDSSNFGDLEALDELRYRMDQDGEEVKLVENGHEEALLAFRQNFTDAKSRDQAELFRKLSRESIERPTAKTFKLLRELEEEVRSDPTKSAFLDKIEGDMRQKMEYQYKKEGEKYLNRVATLDPNDIAVFETFDFDQDFRTQVLQKKTDKLKDFAGRIEDPELFDRFYDRFTQTPELVIQTIKRQDPEFQQTMQFKLRKIEQTRFDKERELERARLDFTERELIHQTDRVDRRQEEEFWNELNDIPWENFDERKSVWENKIQNSLKRTEERFQAQKTIFEERLKIDPFGCDDLCQQIQTQFLDQDLRHQKERLADDLRRERNRIESEQTRFKRDNPLAGKCDTPEACQNYCAEHRSEPSCSWYTQEDEHPVCSPPNYWDPAVRACVASNTFIGNCGEGQYWDGAANSCVQDPYYRPPERFRSCSGGLRWNEERGICESDARNNCSGVLDKTTGRLVYPKECYKDAGHICPASWVWNSRIQDCMPKDFVDCQPGFYFDFSSRRCIQEERTRCGEGMYWDDIKTLCVAVNKVICPSYDPEACPVGYYREPSQDQNGCWLPGSCVPFKDRCPAKPLPCQAGMTRDTFKRVDGCVEYAECKPLICPMVMPRVCAPGEKPLPSDPAKDPCGLNTCIEQFQCPPLGDTSCKQGYRREFYVDEKSCTRSGSCIVNELKPAVYHTFSDGHAVYTKDEAYSYCKQYGPGSGKGISAECQSKFGVVYDTKPETSKWKSYTWKFSDGSETSYILNRTDAEYTNHIAAAEAKCRAVLKSLMRWPSGAGDDTNWQIFGIPDCSGKLPACEAPSYWDSGAGRCVKDTCGDAVCNSSETKDSCPADCGKEYPGDASSCPGFAYSSWDSKGTRYCKLNTEQRCDYNYPSYLNKDNYTAANCPSPTGSTCNYNGVCDNGETSETCSQDCKIAPVSCVPNTANGYSDKQYDCNYGLCPNGCVFTANGCAEKCKPKDGKYCGDGICNSVDETKSNCPVDCGDLAGTCSDTDAKDYKVKGTAKDKTGSYDDYCNGALVVEYICQGTKVVIGSDDPKGYDCKKLGSTYTCENGRCFVPAADVCGDKQCSSTEKANNSCPADCNGSVTSNCGDNVCKDGETPASCPADCKTATSCPNNGFNSASGSFACNYTACPSGCNFDNSGCPVGCWTSGTGTSGKCQGMTGWHYDSTADSCVKDGTTCANSGSCSACKGSSTGTWCQWDANGCPTGCVSNTQSTCGDKWCGSNETATSCPADCNSAKEYPGDASSCPGFAYSSWDSKGTRYCKLNTEQRCDYNYPSYLNKDNYTAAKCPSTASTACNYNGSCEAGESTGSCPQDCKSSSTTSCPSTQYNNYTNSYTCSYSICPNGCNFDNSGCPVSCYSSSGSCNSNGTCENTETSSSCPSDCSSGGTGSNSCNSNGTCESSESYSSCPSDCGGSTSGTCATNYNYCYSSSDCTSHGYSWCNGYCWKDSNNSCSGSSSGSCGDGSCGSSETTASCPADCGSSPGTNGMSSVCYDCQSCKSAGCPGSYPNDSACANFNASACGGSTSYAPSPDSGRIADAVLWQHFSFVMKDFAQSLRKSIGLMSPQFLRIWNKNDEFLDRHYGTLW
ncbi:MAG: hypothetical protein HYY51_04370 [Candidatus Magasanikbacteria bacterium]|nr:hypothetical protein [Candidatus Magasanikbacteria bacterium]